MITKLIFSSILTVLISSGLMLQGDQAIVGSTNAETTQEVDVVKAIMYKGEVIPMIDLPVVEIRAELNTDVMVKATVFEGEVLPMIELEEVLITPNS